MELLLQPNIWTCLPTSFAMVLGVTPKDIFDFLGHDGSEIIAEGDDPHGRKGFHIQEMIAFCLSLYHLPVEIQAKPITMHGDSISHYDNTGLLQEQLANSGVLVGYTKDEKYHAVAWDGELILDPTGFKCPINEFAIETFYAIY